MVSGGVGLVMKAATLGHLLPHQPIAKFTGNSQHLGTQELKFDSETLQPLFSDTSHLLLLTGACSFFLPSSSSSTPFSVNLLNMWNTDFFGVCNYLQTSLPWQLTAIYSRDIEYLFLVMTVYGTKKDRSTPSSIFAGPCSFMTFLVFVLSYNILMKALRYINYVNCLSLTWSSISQQQVQTCFTERMLHEVWDPSSMLFR